MDEDRTRRSLRAMKAFRTAERRFDTVGQATLSAHGLTPAQFGALEVLRSRGPMSVGELMSRILTTSGNMTVVIRNMERNGWVTRSPDPEDRRSFIITLTPEGADLIDSVLPEHASNAESLFSPLSDGELEELTALLSKLRRCRTPFR